MASVVPDQENIVLRMANLPLVSSTCDMASSAHISAKENHPYLKPACEVAEKGVKSITAVALTSAEPLIQKLEPQILTNSYANTGLDKTEEKLPILNQPADKVAADATDMVVSAEEAVAGAGTYVKETVANTITGVVDETKKAVQGSMEMTKTAVSGSMNTVLESNMVQMVSTGVDAALTKSEALVDQSLPLTEEEAVKEASRTEGSEAETQKPSNYIKLGSLSSKIRRHAYEQALTTVKEVKHKSQEAITKLHHTIDLMTYAQKDLSNTKQKLHEVQEQLYQAWVSWKKSIGHQDGEEAPSTEHIEFHALAIAQDLSHQLKTSCLTLLDSIQGLPQNILNQAQCVSGMAGDIYQNFHSAASFRDVSDQLLTTSKSQLKKIKDSLDEVMVYLANNIPLSWLVDPICSELQHKEEQACQQECEHSS